MSIAASPDSASGRAPHGALAPAAARGAVSASGADPAALLGSTIPDEVRSFYAYTPATLAANAAGALVVAVTYWPVSPRLALLGWLTAFAFAWGFRFVMARRFARSELGDIAGWISWWRWWNFGALLTGGMWGLAALLLFSTQHPTQQVVLIVIVTGLGVGAVPVLSEQPKVFHAYVALSLLPMILRLLWEGGYDNLQVTVVLMLTLVSMLLLGRSYRRALKRLIALKARTEQLAEQLRIEKAAADGARREAEAANRAKTQFFAAASHDLRQPLHALGLFAEALRGKSQDDEVVHLVNSINSSVDALDGLFGELLDITRIDTGGVAVSPENFSVGELFRRIRLHFEPTAFEKGLALRFRGEQHHAYADPVLVERIVRNLVSNAIRYTEDGGVLVAARRRGDHLQLQVWDSGIGIRDSEQDKVFEEFYQITGAAPRATPNQRKGLGLGLAIVKRLADLMQAPLTLRSQVGRGTVFTLELPLGRPPRAAVESAKRGSAVGLTLVDRRIVIVEDEPAVLSGLEVLLKGWGAAVQAFDGATAALHWASAEATAMRPDLLIADYRLESGHTGVEIIGAMRQRFGAALPAIVVTGSMMSVHEQEAQEHDFHLLIKPVAPNKLRAMIGFKLGLRSA